MTRIARLLSVLAATAAGLAGQTFDGKFDHHAVRAISSNKLGGPVPTTASGSVPITSNGLFQGTLTFNMPEDTPSSTGLSGNSWALASNLNVTVSLKGNFTITPTRDFVRTGIKL